jgi:hypothetical protein
MPKQIFDSKTFKNLIDRAEEIRVSRDKGRTKLKLKTKGMLYTYVSDEDEAEKLLKNVDKPIVELTPKPAEDKQARKKGRKSSGEEEKKEEAEKEGDGKTRERPPPAKK